MNNEIIDRAVIKVGITLLITMSISQHQFSRFDLVMMMPFLLVLLIGSIVDLLREVFKK